MQEDAVTQELARSGSVVATEERRGGTTRWEIANDKLRYALEWRDGRMTFAGIATADGTVAFDGASGGAARAAQPLISLRLSGLSDTSLHDLKLDRTSAEIRDGAVQVSIHLESAELALSVNILSHPGQAIVEQWVEIGSSRSATLTHASPLVLALAIQGETTVHTVAGVQRQGGWQPESGPYRSFRFEERVLNRPWRIESGLRSTWDEMPWAAFTDKGATSGGVLLAFEYGGRWALNARPEDDGTAFSASFAAVGIESTLEPDETFRSPSAWLGIFPSDLDSAAAVMHDFLRTIVVPPRPDDFPWVQYNTWFSWYCELDADNLVQEADIAAELGAEVFYVDAGWWVGNPMLRDQFSSGLGNWTENRDKFPDGLADFAERIRRAGMHFGIWFEPERVDLRTAATGTWKPEWIARHGDRWVRCDWPADTDTAWLCFGSPEVQDWATATISTVIADTGARWLKWDSNYWGVCTSPDHGHGTGDGEAAQLEGVYAVMDRLRTRFPGLIIENCAGGATRMDFRIARHTHAAWMDDASEPAHRTRFHTAGASYVYPPDLLNAWVTESRYENLNGQNLPDPIVRAVIRSRMFGALGFSCQLQTWSTGTRRIMREEVARYKAIVRPLVRHGYMKHLLPQPRLESPRLAAPNVWEAWALVSANQCEAVALAFRNASPVAGLTLRFKDLEAGTTYRVTVEGEAMAEFTGQHLCEVGIEVACAPLASVFVHLTSGAL